MRWLGYRRVALKSIRVDAADIRARMKEKHVAELAENIKEHGEEPAHAPSVRSPRQGMGLLCGRDRCAAMMLLKAKQIWIHVAECTDEEAIDLEASENVHRRNDNRTELLARASKAKAEMLRQKATASGNTVTPSDQSIKATARKEVAKAAGVTPAAVKRAEQRAKAKDVAPRGHGAQGEPATGRESPHETPAVGDNLPAFEREEPKLPRSFDTFGLPPQINVQLTIDTITNLGMWDQQVRGLLSYLTRFEGKDAALAGGHVQAIREALQGAGHAIRNAVPVRLCFYCKGRADLRAACFACGQTGVMGRNDGENAPAELRALGKAAQVAAGGKFVPYDGSVEAAGLSPKKTARRVSVLDEAGRELVIDRTEAQ